MQHVNSIDDITDSDIQAWLAAQLRDSQRTDVYFLLVEQGDTVEALESTTGCPIVTSWFNAAVYPSNDFAPCFEFVEEHRHFFEMVFVLNDDSATQVFIIPKFKAIDSRLLALCTQYASVT